jgi:flagellar hook-associated protein FlgK
VGDPLESLVTLTEAEIAYRANAVVLETASDMLDTLLDTLDAQSGQS